MQEPDDEEGFVRVNRVQLHYTTYGTRGRPIVLLHGVASNSRIWNMVGPILGHRFRVLAVDQRGHGESEKPASGYDFPTVVADLNMFLQSQAIRRPVIVGHSWGGNVALEFAATYLDAASGLVLVDGGFLDLSSRPGMTWERAEQEMAPPDLTTFTPQALLEAARQWDLGRIWNERVESALMGNFHVTADGTIRPNLSRANHMQIVRALWEQRPSALYAKVLVPALFVLAERAGGGHATQWMEAKRQAIARAERLLARCQVQWLEDTIHDIPLHRPRELAEAISLFAAGLDT